MVALGIWFPRTTPEARFPRRESRSQSSEAQHFQGVDRTERLRAIDRDFLRKRRHRPAFVVVNMATNGPRITEVPLAPEPKLSNLATYDTEFPRMKFSGISCMQPRSAFYRTTPIYGISENSVHRKLAVSEKISSETVRKGIRVAFGPRFLAL
jgi:hypothetical protein